MAGVTSFDSTPDARRSVGPDTGTVDSRLPGRGWKSWGAGALGALLVVLLLRESFVSMASQWYSSTTYSYGFLIVPVVLVLLWRDRHQLVRVGLRPVLSPVILMVPVSLLWAVGVVLNVDGLHHLAAVMLLVLAIWASVGHAAARQMAFPLAYLFFMVPFGEVMVPYLMRLTANAAVLGVQWSGVPVFQDGFLFSLPSGDFEVIKACSGIRFLMTTLAAGAVFAYIAYTSLSRRLLFMIACCLVPVAANLLRTYGVVMVAHLSDMRFGAGADHVLAGTIFFGAVLIAMFLVGARFAETPREDDDELVHSNDNHRAEAAHRFRQTVVIALVTGLLVLTSLLPAAAGARLKSLTVIELPVLPAHLPGWTGPYAGPPDWRPDFAGAAREDLVSYISADARVAVYVAAYGVQEAGVELVNSVNAVYNTDAWRVITTGRGQLNRATGAVPYVETVLRDRQGRGRVVWHWYAVNGHYVTGAARAKLLELRALLAGEKIVAGAIVLSAGFSSDETEARADLTRFIGSL